MIMLIVMSEDEVASIYICVLPKQSSRNQVGNLHNAPKYNNPGLSYWFINAYVHNAYIYNNNND